MFRVLRSLWADDAGLVVSSELVLLMGVGVLGVGAGVRTLRNSTVAAFERVGATVTALAPDPEAARALVYQPAAQQPAGASAGNHNVVVVHVYPPAGRFEPPAP